MQAGEAAKGVGKTYERATGRDAESDGKFAGIVAVAGGTVLAAGVRNLALCCRVERQLRVLPSHLGCIA